MLFGQLRWWPAAVDVVPVVLAAGVFILRAPLVLRCTTLEALQSVFRDFGKVRVVPLVQQTLFLL